MDKKHQKYPKNGFFFTHLWTPKIFFQKSGYVTFVPLWCSELHAKKLEKTNEQSLRYLKTDRWTTEHGQGWLLRTPSAKPRVQNKESSLNRQLPAARSKDIALLVTSTTVYSPSNVCWSMIMSELISISSPIIPRWTSLDPPTALEWLSSPEL